MAQAGTRPIQSFPSEIIHLYPNPSSDFFVIERNSNKKEILQLFDMTGKLVMTELLQDFITTIYTQSIEQGVYNAVVSDQGKRVNKRLVILR
ncbi:MAG TPA: T9SS type A sorting domain-containing protein [Nitrosopumilaceae archaeon]|jgi:hypothetical protein|nr:T9SS type A sorting domain-containing protein [Nitrosopumilaceae archaeon]